MRYRITGCSIVSAAIVVAVGVGMLAAAADDHEASGIDVVHGVAGVRNNAEGATLVDARNHALQTMPVRRVLFDDGTAWQRSGATAWPATFE